MEVLTLNITSSNGLLKAGEILMMGVVSIAGIQWQIYTFKKDNEVEETPFRMKVAIGLCSVAFIGLLVHDILALADPNSNLSIGGFLGNIGKYIILFFSFIIKSLFGPITTAITVLVGIYIFFQFNIILKWNIISACFDWLFSTLPNWAEGLYFVALILVCIGGTIIDNTDVASEF